MQARDRHSLDRWLSIHQPRLRLTVNEHGGFTVSGCFDLTSTEAGAPNLVFETFEVTLDFPENYPASLPTVFETSGRIGHEDDNHINSDGSICYGVPEIILARRPYLTGEAFFAEVLHDYFLGYVHFQEFGTWPFGEVGHGYTGIIDYLAEVLRCEAKPRKIRALIHLLSIKHRRDRWICPCASGKRLGQCCRKTLNQASRTLSRDEAARLRPLTTNLELVDTFVRKREQHRRLTERVNANTARAALQRVSQDSAPNTRSTYVRKRLIRSVSKSALRPGALPSLGSSTFETGGFGAVSY